MFPWDKDNGKVIRTWSEVDDETKERVLALIVQVPQENGWTQTVWYITQNDDCYPRGEREKMIRLKRE